jgi:ankyrin repeat protein
VSEEVTLKPMESSKLLDRLFTFIREKNPSQLRQLLDKRIPLNIIEELNGIPLMVAIEHSNLEIVKLLTAAGAEIDMVHNESPLHLAIRLGKRDIVDYFLQQDAKVSLLNREKESVLYAAIRSRDLNLVQLIVKKGASLDIVNSNNMSPLFVAVGLRLIPIVKFLLNNDADPNTNGLSCLRLAQEQRDVPMINILVSAGAKSQIRRAHRSRQQQSVLAFTTPSKTKVRKAENGVCSICESRFGLVKLIPCQHVVVCKKCVDNFAERNTFCPICKMGFYATGGGR